jgi:hypothetical protein
MPKYIVTVQVFACAGDEFEVDAPNERVAEDIAESFAQKRFCDNYYQDNHAYSLHEVCISCIEKEV